MAKVYKVELYVTDIDDFYEGVSINNHLESTLERLEGLYFISKLKESDEFEWDDGLKINSINATSEDLEKYFSDKM